MPSCVSSAQPLSRALADSAPLDPAQVYAEHARRKTVTGMDVVYGARSPGRTSTRPHTLALALTPCLARRLPALRRNGRVLYGFGG